MSALPVITAMGGINAAGRSALHFGFQRLIFDALPDGGRQDTLRSLGQLTGRAPDDQLAATLIRAMPDSHRLHAAISGTSDIPVTLEMRNMDLPDPLPAGWQGHPARGAGSACSP
jgi:acetoacetyl-[acyl-carrier protein] synthase